MDETTLFPEATKRLYEHGQHLLAAEPDLNSAHALLQTLGVLLHSEFEQMDTVTMDSLGMLTAQYRAVMDRFERGMHALHGEAKEGKDAH